MNLNKRALRLVATVGFLSGMVCLAAPQTAHAMVVGECSGIQLLGKFLPPLAAGGAPTPTVLSLKTAKTSTVAWGAGFGFAETATGAASCTIDGTTYNDARVAAKLTGTVSCDPTSIDSSLYPLHGKAVIRYASNTKKITMFIRVVGYDPVPGPDVIAVTGMVVPSSSADLGATVGGDLFVDPILKAGANDDPVALAQGATPGQVFRNQYFFDNSQIANPCAAGGNAISTVWSGDGSSLLGSIATGLDWEL